MKSSHKTLLLLSLALCWGPSFFFIKVALTHFSTFTLVNIRLLLASLILIGILKIQKQSFLAFKHLWKKFAIMGFFASAFPFILITFAETSIPSSLAGIINATTPIFTVILAHIFLEGEKLNFRTVFGILLGFLGIVLIFLPSLLNGFEATVAGVIYILIASISYGIGMVYSRKHLKNLPSLIGPTWQVFTGGIMLLPMTFYMDKPWQLTLPPLPAALALLSLTLLGTVLAFILYYVIVSKIGATYLSTSTLLFPLVSILLGSFILHERLSIYAYIGGGMILMGLVTANALIPLTTIHKLFTKVLPRKEPMAFEDASIKIVEESSLDK